MTVNQEYMLIAAFILMGGFVFFLGFTRMRRHRLIRDTPRSKIQSMAMGLVEIHGSVATDQVILAPLSRTECAYWKLEIKEYRRESSSKGKSVTYKWVSAGASENHVPFFAVDETGRVRVEPDRAEFLLSPSRTYYEKSRGLGGSLGALSRTFKMMKKGANVDSDFLGVDMERLKLIAPGSGPGTARVGDRRYHETTIEAKDTLFLLGTAAREAEAAGEVVIRRGRNEKVFIISDKGEKQVLKRLKTTMLVSFIFGGIFFAAGVVMLLMNLGLIPKG